MTDYLWLDIGEHAPDLVISVIKIPRDSTNMYEFGKNQAGPKFVLAGALYCNLLAFERFVDRKGMEQCRGCERDASKLSRAIHQSRGQVMPSHSSTPKADAQLEGNFSPAVFSVLTFMASGLLLATFILRRRPFKSAQAPATPSQGGHR